MKKKSVGFDFDKEWEFVQNATHALNDENRAALGEIVFYLQSTLARAEKSMAEILIYLELKDLYLQKSAEIQK